MKYWWLAIWLGDVGRLHCLRRAQLAASRSEPLRVPQCQHGAGLYDGRKHCDDVEDYSGWITDRCRCQSDDHWNYESVTADDGGG
jgi:hypothetical protein